MGTMREVTRQLKIQQWLGIIHDRVQSGMTIIDYCRKNGLSRDAYFYWAKIIKEQALQELPGRKFVELPAVCQNEMIPETPDNLSADNASSLLINVNGINITVTETTSSSLLARTLEVVKNVT